MLDANNNEVKTGDAPNAQGAPAPASQTQDPPKPTDTTPKGSTESEIAARLDKARADEKSKQHGKIDLLTKEKDALAAQNKKTEADLKAAQKVLDELRAGKTTEVDTLQKEIQEMRTRSEKLEKAIELVATEAAQKIQQSEVNAFREKVIREQGIELAELVVGNTTEEITASVAKAKAREEELKTKFTKSPNPAPAPAAAPPTKDTSGLPRPISPDGSQGRDMVQDLGSPANREALSKLPAKDYQQKRDMLLMEAKRKAGLL